MLNASAFPIPPEQCTLSTCSLDEAQIQYLPSIPGNAIYLGIFSILLITHTVQGIYYRTWGVLVGMFAGLFLEVFGYASRLRMHFNPFKSGPNTTQFICLTLGPAFLSASIYLCLARLVIVHGQGYSFLKPRTISILFACCDFVSLLLQSIGGAITATAQTLHFSDLGIHIMLGGLSFQIFSLLLFMGVWIVFNLRVRNGLENPLEEKSEVDFSNLTTSFKFKGLKVALWVAAICIFIRSVYRLIELHAGFASAAANNQPAFMSLEGPMIIIAATVLTVFHPGYAFNGWWQAATWSFRERKSNNSAA